MEFPIYQALVRRAARAICATTNIAPPGTGDVIFDVPDDLAWDTSASPPIPVPRWRLYEGPGRAAVDALDLPQLADMATFIIRQVERGRNATAPQIADHAFREIEALARNILQRTERG
jgi:hypothetical protein